MLFWQVVILLSLVAGAFVIWPLLKFPFNKSKVSAQVGRDETQIALYEEHLEDLEKAKAAGDIDEEQFQELKVELQKTLIVEEANESEIKLQSGGKRLVVALAVAIPVVALIFYSQTGAKKDWDIYQFLEELPKAESQDEYNKRMRELVVMTQARLKQKPDDYSLRNLLAQTSMALQDYDQAVNAYKKLLEGFPESPQIMSRLAQAMFYRSGNQVTPEVREYVKAALAMAPMLPEMLGLAGIDAKNRGDYREAIRYWKMAVSQLNPNSRVAKQYLDGIAKAEQALKSSGQTVEEGSKDDKPKADLASIDIKVNLGDKVKFAAGDTLFVYARAWQGPKMPLAIKRMPAGNFPVSIHLDESMAMAPGMDIKSFPELEIVARISKSGGAVPQSGDWQATAGPIKLSELNGALELTISEQLP